LKILSKFQNSSSKIHFQSENAFLSIFEVGNYPVDGVILKSVILLHIMQHENYFFRAGFDVRFTNFILIFPFYPLFFTLSTLPKFTRIWLHIYLECDSSREFHAAKYFYADFKILTFGSNIIDIQICSWTIMNGMRGILCRINGDLIANFSPLSGSMIWLAGWQLDHVPW